MEGKYRNWRERVRESLDLGCSGDRIGFFEEGIDKLRFKVEGW